METCKRWSSYGARFSPITSSEVELMETSSGLNGVVAIRFPITSSEVELMETCRHGE